MLLTNALEKDYRKRNVEFFPFRVMKTFWTYSCQMCVNEKVEVLWCSEAGQMGRIMNSWLKWDEACPHVAHFHRFAFCTSTDEDFNPEKVDNDHSEGEAWESLVSPGQTFLGSQLVSLDLTQGDEQIDCNYRYNDRTWALNAVISASA